jgi:hypothetical protein
MPHRRTFATGILPFAHSDAACALGILPSLAANAGSRGTGSPSLRQATGFCTGLRP